MKNEKSLTLVLQAKYRECAMGKFANVVVMKIDLKLKIIIKL